MGICPGCGEPVKTRDTFDIVVESHGQDFKAGGPKLVRAYWHRDHNPAADHTKD